MSSSLASMSRNLVIFIENQLFGSLIIYTAFHVELPFLELDYTASAKCRYQSQRSMDNQQKKNI
jgi:hypothetical protein